MQYQRYFIAVGELGAAVAFSPDLPGELGLVNQNEAAFLEEGRLICQAEDSRNTQFISLFQAFLYQSLPDTLPLTALGDRQRFNLCQIGPTHMKRRTGNHLFALSDDEIVPDELVDLAQGAGQHFALGSESVDKLMHLVRVGYFSLLDFHLSLLSFSQPLHQRTIE